MKQKFRHRSTYQAYFRWGERSKRKSCMLSLLSRLIFTETLLELCLAGRWFYFNSRLVHLCTEIPPVGNLEGMCSLEMSISTSFFCLLCFWEEPTALHRFCCVWLWVKRWKYNHCLCQISRASVNCTTCDGNPAFPWQWKSCFSMTVGFLSPLQNPHQQARCGTVPDNVFKGSFLHKAHFLLPWQKGGLILL